MQTFYFLVALVTNNRNSFTESLRRLRSNGRLISDNRKIWEWEITSEENWVRKLQPISGLLPGSDLTYNLLIDKEETSGDREDILQTNAANSMNIILE